MPWLIGHAKPQVGRTNFFVTPPLLLKGHGWIAGWLPFIG